MSMADARHTGEHTWWSRNVFETPRVSSVNGRDRSSCKGSATHPLEGSCQEATLNLSQFVEG
jgi:hypothetical protein